jgi:dimethylargininase
MKREREEGSMPVALTREISPLFERCELTHLSRCRIDLGRAREQHRAYEAALTRLGCTVRRLPELPDCPDGVFVADPAFVFDEVAVIARPGAESRRAETASVAEALAAFRPLRFIEAPGTLDGGDVLRIGRTVLVGQSARTNSAGFQQMRDLLAPHGYDVRPIAVTGCLHLQTAITDVAEAVVLVNPAWMDVSRLDGVEVVEVDRAEPFAANALRIGDAVLYPDAFPRTRARLEARGIRVVTVDVSELAKAEAGVTCCSLIV